MDAEVEFMPVNERMLEIIRLHLANYEILEPEDRKLYRKVVEVMLDPPMALHKSPI